MSDLKHYGILGMKWGRRKGGGSVTVGRGVRGALREAGGLFKDALKDDVGKIRSAAAKRAAAKQPSADFTKTKDLRKKKVQSLSNDELKTVITRLQLEKQFKDLSGQQTARGNRFVSGFLKNLGGMAVNTFVRQASGPDYSSYQTFADAVRKKAKGG